MFEQKLQSVLAQIVSQVQAYVSSGLSVQNWATPPSLGQPCENHPTCKLGAQSVLETFGKFDADGSGAIDFSEFGECRRILIDWQK